MPAAFHPAPFVVCAMRRAVMGPADRHDEIIVGFAAERPGLNIAQMPAACDRRRLRMT